LKEGTLARLTVLSLLFDIRKKTRHRLHPRALDHVRLQGPLKEASKAPGSRGSGNGTTLGGGGGKWDGKSKQIERWSFFFDSSRLLSSFLSFSLSNAVLLSTSPPHPSTRCVLNNFQLPALSASSFRKINTKRKRERERSFSSFAKTSQ